MNDNENKKQVSQESVTSQFKNEPPNFNNMNKIHTPQRKRMKPSNLYTYTSNTLTGKILTVLSPYLITSPTHRGSALPSFICLLLITCANHMLGPMRDAAALAVGVSHIPSLTLASTWLALASSVPVGWLFEAPDPKRMAVWKRFGFTRGETQGTSLALFYRVFAIFLIIYAIAFKIAESPNSRINRFFQFLCAPLGEHVRNLMSDKIGTAGYATFYLVVHLMKLHSTSLIWGVTSEAMEYEEQAEIREGAVQDLGDSQSTERSNNTKNDKYTGRSKIRLKRLAFVGFGGTMGGIIGSTIVSFAAHSLRLSGLLVIASILLETCANLAIELGKIMHRHWQEEEEERQALIAQQEVYNVYRNEENYQNNEDKDYVEYSGDLKPPCDQTQYIIVEKENQQGSEHMFQQGISLKRNRSMTHISSLKSLNGDNSENTGSGGGGLSRMKQSYSCGAINTMENTMEEQPISLPNLQEIDSSLKRSISGGSMKRVASGTSINGMKRSSSMKRVASGNSINSLRRSSSTSSSGLTHRQNQSGNSVANNQDQLPTPLHENNRTNGMNSDFSSKNPPSNITNYDEQESEMQVDDNSFKQRLRRGVTTIVRSKLLLTIFTYNALYASTSVLLSFQRAQLVADRSETSSSPTSAESDSAFLAKINICSNVAVFALQASGLGAYIAHTCGQRGTLSLMPIVRFCGVILLACWHFYGNGRPPNLIIFLVLDEFTRVINFAVAKPVRESLWRGLSNEARYEAKPIVDTLANRWGSGSAAFLVGCIDKFLDLLNFGEDEEGNKRIFGFPPTLLLLLVISGWWTGVSAHLGIVRNNIDRELKKQKLQ